MLTLCQLVFVVQDSETGEFLCPFMGDVGFTNQLRTAGHFIEPDSAIETASDYMDHFQVIPFYLPADAKLNTN